MDHDQREELEEILKEGGSTMARVDYSARDLAGLGRGSIVTTPEEGIVAIKLAGESWGVSEYPLPVHNCHMHNFSEEWSNVRTILRKRVNDD